MGLSLSLPYPPSINHYWRINRYGRGMRISDEGKAYREAVIKACSGQWKIHGPLAVRLSLNPPDRRRRDIDNVQKPLLDALQHAGVYDDDSQIEWLLTERRGVLKGGAVSVVIASMLSAEWVKDVLL